MTNPFTHQPLVVLSLVLAVVFLVREYVTFKKKLPLKYLFTPSITAMLAGIVVMAFYYNGVSAYGILILTALILSLIADVMLMIVEIDLLKYGIVYFLSAHVVYIFAFSRDVECQPWHWGSALLLLASVLVFYHRIGRHAGRLRIPVILYSVVLATMIFFALAGVGGMQYKAKLIAAGGLLFAISDICLAYNAFKKKVEHSSVITWATYAPAQFLFAMSCFY